MRSNGIRTLGRLKARANVCVPSATRLLKDVRANRLPTSSSENETANQALHAIGGGRRSVSAIVRKLKGS